MVLPVVRVLPILLSLGFTLCATLNISFFESVNTKFALSAHTTYEFCSYQLNEISVTHFTVDQLHLWIRPNDTSVSRTEERPTRTTGVRDEVLFDADPGVMTAYESGLYLVGAAGRCGRLSCHLGLHVNGRRVAEAGYREHGYWGSEKIAWSIQTLQSVQYLNRGDRVELRLSDGCLVANAEWSAKLQAVLYLPDGNRNTAGD